MRRECYRLLKTRFLRSRHVGTRKSLKLCDTSYEFKGVKYHMEKLLESKLILNGTVVASPFQRPAFVKIKMSFRFHSTTRDRFQRFHRILAIQE